MRKQKWHRYFYETIQIGWWYGINPNQKIYIAMDDGAREYKWNLKSVNYDRGFEDQETVDSFTSFRELKAYVAEIMEA